jgi:hypothetical protein
VLEVQTKQSWRLLTRGEGSEQASEVRAVDFIPVDVQQVKDGGEESRKTCQLSIAIMRCLS